MRASRDPRRALAIVAACAALVALVALGLEVVAYETTRERWRAISEHVEAARGYDADASDALYDAVRARRADAKRNAWIAAAMLLVAASFAGRRTSASERDDPAPGRVLAASVLDVTLTSLAITGAVGLTRSSTSIAAADALAIVAPALVAATLVAMVARGATASMHALGLTLVPSPGPLRAVLVIALLPITALWLVIAALPLALVILAGRTPGPTLLAPHVSFAGLRVERRAKTTTPAPDRST